MYSGRFGIALIQFIYLNLYFILNHFHNFNSIFVFSWKDWNIYTFYSTKVYVLGNVHFIRKFEIVFCYWKYFINFEKMKIILYPRWTFNGQTQNIFEKMAHQQDYHTPYQIAIVRTRINFEAMNRKPLTRKE